MNKPREKVETLKKEERKTKRSMLHPEIMWENGVKLLYEDRKMKHSGESFVSEFDKIVCSSQMTALMATSRDAMSSRVIEAHEAAGIPSEFLIEPFDYVDFNDGRHQMVTNSMVSWAVYKWGRNGKPVYRLSKDLTKALAFTEVKDEVFQWDPNRCLPLDGMFLSFDPGLIGIETNYDGDFDMEGLYLIVDKIMVPRETLVDRGIPLDPDVINSKPSMLSEKYIGTLEGNPNFVLKPCISIIGVSTDRSKGEFMERNKNSFRLKEGLGVEGSPVLDDLVIHTKFIQGMEWHMNYSEDQDNRGRSIKNQSILFRLAYNFLWFVHNFPSALSQTQINIKTKGWRSERSKRREEERSIKKRRTSSSYTFLDLVTKNTKRANPKSGEGKKLTRPVIVPGHVNYYWTGPRKDHGEEIPFEEWPNRRTRVKKWILPYRKGPVDGVVKDKNVIVRW